MPQPLLDILTAHKRTLIIITIAAALLLLPLAGYAFYSSLAATDSTPATNPKKITTNSQNNLKDANQHKNSSQTEPKKTQPPNKKTKNSKPSDKSNSVAKAKPGKPSTPVAKKPGSSSSPKPSQAPPKANQPAPNLPPKIPPVPLPSGVAMPSGNVTGWQQVFADDFTTGAIKPQWARYSGRYGQDLGGYASLSHVYNSGGVMHLYGSQDSSGYYGNQWYSGGACLCGKSGDNWLDVNDIRVTYRWRVIDKTTGLKPVYAFLRWPKAENWPSGGEEDFMEGQLAKNARTEVSMHGVDSSGNHKKHYWKPIAYDPTVWHTATYSRQGYTIVLNIDGVEVMRYTGNSQSLPNNAKHIVFQQQCNESVGCPNGGSSDVQIDWVVVSRPR